MLRNILDATTLLLVIVGLCACGGGGGGGTTPINPAAPTVPGGLSTQVVSTGQIDLDWNPATDDVAVFGYYLYGHGSPAVSLDTSYSVTGLAPATQYCFSVAAFDGDGNSSPQSTAVCATTQAAAPSAWSTVRSGTGNEFSNIVWTGSRLLVVEETFGSSTSVHTSTDGLDWSVTPTSGFAFNGARDVVYGNNRYVAVDSWLFTSPDGIAWTLDSSVDLSAVQALAWSPTLALFVAVGEAGFVATSPDGSSWTTIAPAPTANDLYGVAWLNGRFLAVGDPGTILSSADGLAWTTATTPAATFGLKSVAWNGQSGGGARYVATGYGTVFTSADGDSWSAAAAPPPGYNDSVVWGGGSANCFVTVGLSNHIFSSPDGETWTRRFLATDPVYAQLDLSEIAWTGSRFVAVGQQGTTFASSDGTSWEIVTSGADLHGLADDGSRFIAVGANGRVAVSTDADSWEYRHTGDDSHYLYDLVWDGSRYLGVGQTYDLHSADLVNWQSSWQGATSVDTAIVAVGGQFVKTTDFGILIWDGTSLHTGTTDPWWKWSLFDSSYPYLNLQDILWNGSQFLAVGDNGAVYTSPDATEASTWTLQTSGTASNLRAVTQGAGRFVAVGATGTILSSDDSGVSWTPQSSGVSVTLDDVTWDGGRFVAVGASGTVLTSDNGVSWSAEDLGNTHLYSVLSSGADTVIVGAEGTIIRNNP